jgi:hypothetical protein
LVKNKREKGMSERKDRDRESDIPETFREPFVVIGLELSGVIGLMAAVIMVIGLLYSDGLRWVDVPVFAGVFLSTVIGSLLLFGAAKALTYLRTIANYTIARHEDAQAPSGPIPVDPPNPIRPAAGRWVRRQPLS